MSVSDIFALILAWFVVAIFFCILERIREDKECSAIISFKNFRRIFSVFSANFTLNGGCIYYKNEYKIFVKFPFKSLAKMMVRAEIRNRKKKAKKRIEYANTKDFISALEKDIAKMSKESENYVAQAREIVERIGKE